MKIEDKRERSSWVPAVQILEQIIMYLENYRIFLTFTLALTLTHEIYHHLVRGQRRFRKPTDKLEETKAAQWSQQQSKAILLKLFPPDRCRNEIDEFSRLWDEVWLKSDRRI